MQFITLYAWYRTRLTKTLRVMRITAFMLFIFCLHVNAKVVSQAITLSGKDIPAERLFAEVKKQTGYVVVCNEDLLRKLKPVSLNALRLPLKSFLEEAFRGQPVDFEIMRTTVGVREKRSGVVEDMDPPVRGVVLDSAGHPLVGATVRVKGKKMMVSTDAEGKFEVEMNEGEEIVVSYVGFRERVVKVSAGKMMVVRMEREVREEEEVVVANTGYQKVKINEMNGAVNVITNKQLNEQVSPNFLDRLKGVSNAILFSMATQGRSSLLGTSENIMIRGLSTINGFTNPLIVLDNFIYDGDLRNINPYDIENVTILKDAAASSIWGSLGGNGVIVITTKKGGLNKPLKIGVNTNVSFSDPPPSQARFFIPSSDYIDIEEYLFNKGYDFGGAIGDGKSALTPVISLLLDHKKGKIDAADSALIIDRLKKINGIDNYEKQYYQKNLTQQYSVNLSGGSQSLAWAVSGGYMQSKDYLAAKNNRANIRLDNTYVPVKNLSLKVSAYYTSSESISGDIYSSKYISDIEGGRGIPYFEVTSESGIPTPFYSRRKEFIDTIGGGLLLDWRMYPLEEQKLTKKKANLNQLISQIGLNYAFKDLKISLDYQFQKQNSITNTVYSKDSYIARDLINNYTQINYSRKTINRIIPLGDILDKSQSAVRSTNLRAQIDYSKSISKNHRINLMLGEELREVITDGAYATRFYAYNEDPLTFGRVDFFNSYPKLTATGTSQIEGYPSLKAQTTTRRISFYGNIGYSFKQRYSITGSIRKDAANMFGLKANDKWNPFSSIAFGWDFSKEEFYKFKPVPFARLRVSMGTSGNIDPYKTPIPIGGFSTDITTNYPTASIGTPNNPSLKWERVVQWNLAIDFSSANQRISGSVDYFIKEGKDLYAPAPYDYTTFGSTIDPTRNVANVSGKGVDLAIRSKNMSSKTFEWGSSFNYSYALSKTKKYYDDASKKLGTFLGKGNAITPVVGKPLYSLVVYKWRGLSSSGDPQGFLDGNISIDYPKIRSNVSKGIGDESIIYIGTTSPKSFGNLSNNIRWKQILLSFNIVYRLGYYYMQPSFTSLNMLNSGIGYIDYYQRWTKPGDEMKTNVPALVYKNYLNFDFRDDFYLKSEANVQKADNIRLSNIKLEYNFQSSLLSRKKGDVVLNLNISNVGLLWKASKGDIDPDYGINLQAKQYAIGATINL